MGLKKGGFSLIFQGVSRFFCERIFIVGSKQVSNAVVWIGVVAAGVILGGWLLNWGRNNDIPGFAEAHKGFDS